MRRTSPTSTDEPGQDSFLDIVANIVGILIILVMVAGVRAAHAPSDLADDATDALAQTRLRAVSLVTDVHALQQQSLLIERDVEIKRLERERMNTLVAAVEEEMAKRREMLDADTRRDYDLRHKLTDAQTDLARLTNERLALESVAPKTVTIESLPTPLSRTVEGKEVHFQLLGGRVTVIPLEKLLEEFKSVARHQMWKFENRTQWTDTVGPIDGFRLRYTLQRFEIPRETQLQTGRGGSIVQLTSWELLPVSSKLGETVDVALSPGSVFRRTLASLGRQRATITIWTYPDSFAEFRRLKRELYALDIQTASRPLPEGVWIGGSPLGSKSASQ